VEPLQQILDVVVAVRAGAILHRPSVRLCNCFESEADDACVADQVQEPICCSQRTLTVAQRQPQRAHGLLRNDCIAAAAQPATCCACSSAEHVFSSGPWSQNFKVTGELAGNCCTQLRAAAACTAVGALLSFTVRFWRVSSTAGWASQSEVARSGPASSTRLSAASSASCGRPGCTAAQNAATQGCTGALRKCKACRWQVALPSPAD
jgi:hypothetical protein